MKILNLYAGIGGNRALWGDEDGQTYIQYFVIDEGGSLLCTDAVDPETVGQYTSLKDKNGKEIYEWDVVETIRKEQPYRYSIIWNGPAARWDLQPTDLPSSQPFGGDMNRCEVIGNIYENPELTKEAK